MLLLYSSLLGAPVPAYHYQPADEVYWAPAPQPAPAAAAFSAATVPDASAAIAAAADATARLHALDVDEASAANDKLFAALASHNADEAATAANIAANKAGVAAGSGFAEAAAEFSNWLSTEEGQLALEAAIEHSRPSPEAVAAVANEAAEQTAEIADVKSGEAIEVGGVAVPLVASAVATAARLLLTTYRRQGLGGLGRIAPQLLTPLEMYAADAITSGHIKTLDRIRYEAAQIPNRREEFTVIPKAEAAIDSALLLATSAGAAAHAGAVSAASGAASTLTDATNSWRVSEDTPATAAPPDASTRCREKGCQGAGE